MRISLRPNNATFYDLFNRAAENLAQATGLLTELSLPDSDIESVSESLGKLEHDSDALTHELYNHLNSTFITPFDREDIYRLGSGLDDVMDHLEAVGGLLFLYGLTALPPLPSELHELVSVLDQQARLTVTSLPRLSGRRELSDYWTHCGRLENEGDRAYRSLLIHLFSGEYDALTVMKLKEVADELESACDAFDAVANCVRTIMVKES